MRIKRNRFILELSRDKIHFQIALKKPQIILGFTNKINDDAFIPFFDFDKVNFMNVVSFLAYLEKVYGIDEYIILESSENSYHLILPCIMSWSEYFKLLVESTKYGVDRKYVYGFYLKGYSVLRFSAKEYKDKRIGIPKVIVAKVKNHEAIEQFVKLPIIKYTTFNY
jgi:hypothetical protein